MTDTIDESTIEFWDWRDDVEQLSHTSIEEAIEGWGSLLDSAPSPDHMLELIGYSRQTLSLEEVERCVLNDLENNILEHLDDEHGPDDHSTVATPGMKEAARVFAKVIWDDYVPWRCDEVMRKRVRIGDYMPPSFFVDDIRNVL